MTIRSRAICSLAFSLFVLTVGFLPPATAQQPAELIIRNGTVVNAEGQFQADIRVRDGSIVEIASNLSGSEGAREIDASGLLVLPGGVDPHVHITTADDYTSGSAAALAGGVTTISNFTFPSAGDSLAASVERHAERIRLQSMADVMLHPTIGDPPTQKAQIRLLPDIGQTSVKVYMNRPVFDRNIRGYLGALAAAGDAGMMTMIHCEDDAIVTWTTERLMSEGKGSLEYFPESRPVLAKVIATRRAVAMAEATGAPIYIVHLSSAGALRVAQEAQERGLPVYVETRPIYLHLTRERFEQPDRGLYVGQPPLREKSDQDALWKGIREGAVHVVGTDHVAHTKEMKLDTAQTVADHHAGMSNLQLLRPMLWWDGVLNKKITEEQFVAVTATNPAKLFGLYPRKGTIAVGSDADLVLWDPSQTRTIRDQDMLSGTGYSVYAGWEVTGWPTMTIRRGEVVYEEGRITAKAGSGRLLHRGRWKAP